MFTPRSLRIRILEPRVPCDGVVPGEAQFAKKAGLLQNDRVSAIWSHSPACGKTDYAKRITS